MNCINLKKRTKKGKPYLYCSLNGVSISFEDCRHCLSKEYKKLFTKEQEHKIERINTIKRKSYKLAKMERNRISILTEDLERCIECGKNNVQLHEVFYGKNRLNSIKYGCVIPLCMDHHTGDNGIHSHRELDNKYKILMQTRFKEVYLEEFIDIFHINYL